MKRKFLTTALLASAGAFGATTAAADEVGSAALVDLGRRGPRP